MHFPEPGTTLQPRAWAAPTQVMVVDHRSDETSLIIRSFLDDGEDEEPGDLLENKVKVPSQKIRGGQNYIEELVFDVCPTSARKKKRPREKKKKTCARRRRCPRRWRSESPPTP